MTKEEIKIENSNLYGIFAWSQKEADLIPQKSWLILLEIFVYEHSLEKAYQLFQQVRNNSLLIKKNEELEKQLLDIPKQLGDITAKFYGSSNLNDDLYR